jgi:NDP-sugar pyrophosphorylase family protein
VSQLTHAVVLAAGLGTRLRPLTTVRAKAAIPVAGEPMARRIIRGLAAHGVHDIVVNLHHLPHTLTATLGDGSDLGATVRYSWEQPEVLGSGGGPRQALPIVGADTFFLVNGDTLTDVDLVAVAASHQQTGALVTLALVPNTSFERYGGVVLDADGLVTGFVHRGPAARGSFHFIGVQIAEAEVFASLLPGAVAASIGGAGGGGVYDELIRHRADSVRGFVSEAQFFDVGTVADYWRTSIAFAPDPSARNILWDDVNIADDAIVKECIVTDGVQVAGGSVYRRQILLRGPDGQTIAEPLGF